MTEKITVSLPDDLVAAARAAVEAGHAASVSGFVADSMAARVRRNRDLDALLAVLGTPPPAEALTEARRLMGLPPAPAA